MKKSILRGFIAIISTILIISVAGCSSVSLPTAKQKLLDLQEETSQKIQALSQKITSAGGNYQGLNAAAIEVSKYIDENIKKLRDISKELESSSIITQTKFILENGKLITAKVAELTQEIEKLSEAVKTLTADAQKQTLEKIEDLKKSIDGLNARLEDIKNKFEAVKKQLFDEEQKKQ